MQDPLGWGYDVGPKTIGSYLRPKIIEPFAMTQMCWLISRLPSPRGAVVAHPKPPFIATRRSGLYVGLARPGSPKHHMADPSANVQGLTRVSPDAEVMVKGQLAIATPTPHGVRATQIPGFRFLLLL